MRETTESFEPSEICIHYILGFFFSLTEEGKVFFFFLIKNVRCYIMLDGTNH